MNEKKKLTFISGAVRQANQDFMQSFIKSNSDGLMCTNYYPKFMLAPFRQSYTKKITSKLSHLFQFLILVLQKL